MEKIVVTGAKWFGCAVFACTAFWVGLLLISGGILLIGLTAVAIYTVGYWIFISTPVWLMVLLPLIAMLVACLTPSKDN